MNIMEAINDPNRPLSVSPEDWIKKGRRGSTVTAAEKKKETAEEMETGAVETIESSIDMIVEGIQLFYEGATKVKRLDVSQKERAILKNVVELMDTAITPYMTDIIAELDKLEGE